MKYTYLLLFILLFSCKGKQDSLEYALRFAGANRSELEKVLQHYSSGTEDSLKYRAAVFLIENMSDCYSLKSEALSSFRASVKEFGLSNAYPVVDDNTRIVQAMTFEDKYNVPNIAYSQKIYDAHIITASYLIDNIEQAFNVWKEAPWGEFVSFDSFCREILPYRVGNEPLEEWRQAYRDMYRPLLEKLQSKSDITEMGRMVYDSIYNQRWIFDNQLINECVGARTLFDCRVGDCRLLSHYAVYAFRSLGIPAGIDCILQNPDMMYRHHYWNYMKDENGRTIPFELYQTAPANPPNQITRKKGKVYRICFDKPATDLTVFHSKELLPYPLNDPHLKDVSDEYFEGANVAIEARDKLIFLGVFNNKTWIPIACAPVSRGKAIFRHLEPGIVWQALSYRDNQFIPASEPFISEQTGECRFLHPDKTNMQTLILERKYPLPDWFKVFRHRSVGGLFQGANKEDFTDATLLHMTTDSLDMYWHKVTVDCPKSFRYLRYYSAPDGHCNMAEIRFFSSGKQLSGEIIGTEGSSEHSITRSKYAVFDDTPETYFDSALPDNTWAGLKLPEPQKVTEIEYLFRTDDNNIREGDVYELFYFSDNELVSLGEQTGTKNSILHYNAAPSNALFWLRNKTRGVEERVFTYEDGKQVFW